MIYLFNSAYSKKYLSNVLNTLYLPFGSTNRYRYVIDQNLNSNSLRDLKKAINQEVTIVFINRFGTNNYIYYPLRSGILLDIVESAPQAHFFVKLREHLSPRDHESLQKAIVTALGSEGLPSLSDDDPFCVRDGEYAINSEINITSNDDWFTEEEAWFTNAKLLSNCEAFMSKHEGGRLEENDSPIFLYSSFLMSGKKKPEDCIRTVGNTTLHKINAGKSVILRVKYFIPRKEEQKLKNLSLLFMSKDVLSISNGSSCPLSNWTDFHDIGLEAMSDADGKSGEIFATSESEQHLILPDVGVKFLVVKPISYWIFLGLLLLMWAVPVWLSDPIIISHLGILKIWPPWNTLIVYLGPLISAVALYLLVSHTRKSFL